MTLIALRSLTGSFCNDVSVHSAVRHYSLTINCGGMRDFLFLADDSRELSKGSGSPLRGTS